VFYREVKQDSLDAVFIRVCVKNFKEHSMNKKNDALKKILIFTSSIDYTVDYIISMYSDTVDFYRVNVDMLQFYTINVNETIWTISTQNWSINSSEIYSIYYRKPRLPDLSEYEIQYINMIKKDIIALIEGLVNSFEGFVLTRPYILHNCENKVSQLQKAKKLFLDVPKSLITNVAIDANRFIENVSIIKPLTTGKIIFDNKVEIFQTNLINKLDSDDIRLTPIYLQEYIEKSYEVRATFVGSIVFCVKINSSNKVDWRDEKAINEYEVINMPLDILNKCICLMHLFNINFGAFDFIVDKNGNWIFLEVNPNGQWLWLEEELDLNISGKIIDLLKEDLNEKNIS